MPKPRPAPSAPPRNPDLHGSAPDKSAAALLLIDVINAFDFPEAPQLLRYAPAAMRALAALKARARTAGIPAIYVNDNFGRWRSNFQDTLGHCLRRPRPGRGLVRLLAPAEDDYFILKPKHSGFFSTSLDVLLRYLGARTLILGGLAGNLCVQYTANDAYLRDFRLAVPKDCSASNTRSDQDHAFRQMRDALKADIRPCRKLDLVALARGEEGPGPG